MQAHADALPQPLELAGEERGDTRFCDRAEATANSISADSGEMLPPPTILHAYDRG